tara:strand:- start:7678 stop:8169 length:492 start_codon:yes stop_codon:yes gene_type:complete
VKYFPKIALFALVGGILAFGCQKEECDDKIPSLKFESFAITDTGGVLTVSFKDCDGDIGLDEDDVDGVFAPDSLYYNNLFIDRYVLVNGEWVIDNGSANLYYRIPVLDDGSTSSDVKEGDIEVYVAEAAYSQASADTFRFEIWIVDRALQESNHVHSAAYLKP